MGLAAFPVLLSLMLIPLADTCIPTKTPQPGIPAMPTNPLKECGTLDQWDKVSCEASGGPPTCEPPATASPTVFMCPAGFGPLANAPTALLPLNSITCDTSRGEWVLENPQGDKKTKTELEALIPGPYKFYCGK